METINLVTSVVHQAFVVAVWCMAGLALWRGAGPEKASALTLFLLLFIDDVYHLVFGPYYPLQTADPWHVFLDTAALASFVAIALRANRFYPLVLAAAQLVSVIAHMVRIGLAEMTSLSYYLLYVMPFYFEVLILAGGLWRHHRRSRRIGPYREWRGTVTRSPPRPVT